MRSSNNVRLTTSRTFDNVDRLLSVTHTPSASGQLPIAFSYGLNLNSQRTAVTNAEGARWAFSYDLLGQLTSGRRYWPDGAAVAGQQFDYVFDEAGDRLWAARGGDAAGANLRSASYRFNLVNQLTNREVPAYVDVLGRAASNATVTVNNQRVTTRQALEYWRHELSANNSNALALVGITNIGVFQDTTSATNQPSDVVTTNLTGALVPKTPEIFKYDADGNLTNNGLWSFRWDAENRLVEMESVSAVPNSEHRKLVFGYDWQGRRVSKTASNYAIGSWQMENARKWIWDGTRPLAELEATNGTPWLRQWFTWGMDESGTLDGAGGVGGLVGVSKYTADNGAWLAASDGQGNVAGLVKASDGTVDGRLEHGPFGELLRASGRVGDALLLRWSTKYEDAETGFLYYGRRYYDPLTGRWLSRDPIGEAGGVNLYGFVGNDPGDRIDPWGLQLYEQLYRPTGLPRSNWQVGSRPRGSASNFEELEFEREDRYGREWTEGTPAEREAIRNLERLERQAPICFPSAQPPRGQTWMQRPSPLVPLSSASTEPFIPTIQETAILIGSPCPRSFSRQVEPLPSQRFNPEPTPGVWKPGDLLAELEAAERGATLYRVVGPAELADIEANGIFRNFGSAEGKYFTTSAEGASSYARQASRASWGEPPYTLIQTRAPNSIFEGLTPAAVDGGIPAWVIPNNRLPTLSPQILPSMPIPRP